jgi:O-antigen/teichoic acid export membrane protein
MSIINLRTRTGLTLVEQAGSTGWNFILGTLVARWGGVEIFGIFALVMSVYFILNAALGAMSVGIISVDAARLGRSRNSYLFHALQSSERLSFAVAAIAAIVICILALSFPPEHRILTAVAGIVYVTINMLGDIRRRLMALGDHVKFLMIASCLRVAALIALGGVVYFSFAVENRIPYLIFGVIFISFAYVTALGLRAKVKVERDYRLGAITFARQTRMGSWGFASSIVMSGLDQALTIYAGILGLHTIPAEIRAGSYLFGLMNPVMLVFDLMMPALIHHFLGRNMQLSRIGPFVLAGAIFSSVAAAALALLNAKLWLPFLGPEYVPFEVISYWVGISFACMTARSFITPFLRVNAPRAAFKSSIIGISSGLIVVALSKHFDALEICHVMVCTSFVQLVAISIALVFVCRKFAQQRKLQPYATAI